MPVRNSIAILANGRAAADERLRAAVGELRSEGHRVRVLPLWEAGDGQRLTAEALAGGARLLVAAGGDGTLNETLNGLVDAGAAARASLTVLPYGTANDFAKTCGVPLRDPLAALRAALVAPPRWVDVGRANGRYFINAATGGGPSKAAAKAGDLKHTVGRLAYLLVGLRDLSKLDRHDISARWDGGAWKGRILGMAIGNGRQAGGGMRFAPKALLDDGLLDVVIVPEQPVSQWFGTAKELVRPQPGQRRRHMISFRASRLDLQASSRLHFNLDGEPMKQGAYRFEAVARAVTIRVPRPPLKTDGR